MQNVVSGAAFINALLAMCFTVSDTRGLYHVLRDLKSDNRGVAIQLIVARAFSRHELINPSQIASYFARPDWPQILAVWRADPVRREIRHVARRLDRQRCPANTSDSAGTRWPEQRPPAATAAPMSLRGVLETHLPTKTQVMADAVTVALDAMKKEPRTWSIDAIVTRIRNVMGATARIADRLIEEAFRWLAKRGVVENVGGYRLRDTTNDAIGQQILGMVVG